MRIELTLAEILKSLPEGDLQGESSHPAITGIAALDQARPGSSHSGGGLAQAFMAALIPTLAQFW